MRIISLRPIGRVDRALLEPLAEGLTQRLRVACSIQPDGLEAEFAFNPLRRQYHSTEILKKILVPALERIRKDPGRDGHGSLHSRAHLRVRGSATRRRRSGGLRPSLAPGVLRLAHRPRNSSKNGLLKEALHELGHTYGLRHCPDYTCVMSSSNGVERIDLKSAEFCPACARRMPVNEP